MYIGLKDTMNRDVSVATGSAQGSVSFSVADETVFILTNEETRKLVEHLTAWYGEDA